MAHPSPVTLLLRNKRLVLLHIYECEAAWAEEVVSNCEPVNL